MLKLRCAGRSTVDLEASLKEKPSKLANLVCVPKALLVDKRACLSRLVNFGAITRVTKVTGVTRVTGVQGYRGDPEPYEPYEP